MIVSADSHFNEPHDFYHAEYRRFGRIVPHLKRTNDNGDFWVSGSFERPLGVMNRPGQRGVLNTKNLKYEETEWFIDLRERKKHTRADGVCAEALFPSGGMLFSMPDEAAQISCMRRLNDFMASLSGYYQGILICPDNPSRAVEMVKEYGKAGTHFLLPMYNSHSCLHDPEWALFLSLIEKNECTLAFHAGTLDPNLRKLPSHNISNTQVFKTSRLYFQAHHLLMELILGEVFEKHPQLNILVSELGVSWVPYFYHRLTEGLKIYQEFDLSEERILEILQCNFKFTVQFDFPYLGDKSTDSPITKDNIMFGSDFPHVESTYGETKNLADKILARFGKEVTELLLIRNAKKSFRFLDVKTDDN